jgi:hypothetical protein
MLPNIQPGRRAAVLIQDGYRQIQGAAALKALPA